MSSIPQKNLNENGVSDFVTKFISRFHIGRLFFKCNINKEKEILVMAGKRRVQSPCKATDVLVELLRSL